MIVIVFRTLLKPEVNQETLAQLGSRMYELASSMPGYISYKDFAAEDGESAAGRGRITDGDIAIAAEPEPGAGHCEEHRLADVRLVEALHLAREPDVVDGIAADVGIRDRSPDNRRGAQPPDDGNDVALEEGGPAGLARVAVVEDERLEAQQPAVEGDQERTEDEEPIAPPFARAVQRPEGDEPGRRGMCHAGWPSRSGLLRKTVTIPRMLDQETLRNSFSARRNAFRSSWPS